MAFPPVFFRGKQGNFGLVLVTTSAKLGTGGTSIVNSTTTSITLPKPSNCVAQLLGVELQALIAGVPNTGDMLAQIFKRDNSGTPADRTLTGTKSLTSSIVATADKTYAFALTATSVVNLTFQSTDTCRIAVVCTDTVTTQPTAVIAALWAITRMGT